MHPLVRRRLPQIQALCSRFRVRRLSLFGSSAAPPSNAEPRDIDLLVEFESMDPAGHADAYFGLLEQLEDLFQMPVDLVELAAIRNPVFKQAVDLTEIPLYGAA